jgi:nucleoside-diphosphate-sugar epimerase
MPGPVALTGATGFIGRHVAERLTAAGLQVRALTRRTGPDRPNLAWIPGDLHHPDALATLVDGAEAVVHCAGAVRGASAAHFNSVNVDGTRQLLDAVRRRERPARFLLISSLAAREPGLSWYAHSKRAAELVVERESAAVPWTVLRPPAVYGPGDQEIVPLFRAMRRGWLPLAGPADARFSLLQVGDLAGAVAAWLGAAASRDTFEIHDGTPEGYDWNAIRQQAEEAWGRPIRCVRLPLPLLRGAAWTNLLLARTTGRAPMLTPGKVRELTHTDWVCDNTRVEQSLEWRPAIRLADALRRPSLAGL